MHTYLCKCIHIYVNVSNLQHNRENEAQISRLKAQLKQEKERLYYHSHAYLYNVHKYIIYYM